jgi:hypothetical protein
MALYQTPKAAILGAIKALNGGVVLLENEYTFGLPAAVTPASDGTNTTILISARDAASTFDGSVTVRYTRLNLADLLVLVPATLQLPPVTSTLQFAQAFNKVYGTVFDSTDLVDEPVSLVNGAGDVTLTARASSMGWLGSVTFHVEKGRTDIASEVTVTTLPGLNFPDPYEGKPFGWAYSYWRNFSGQYDIINGVVANDPDWATIAQLLSTQSGDTWVTTGASRFSLSGATCDYAGPTSEVARANQSYASVVVLTLGADCLGFSGRMYLHFSPPETDI